MGEIIRSKHQKFVFSSLLILVFAVVFGYIFDPKLNLGGDNCDYYMFSTSLAQGDGYSNLMNPDKPPTSSFPPGYPVLMAGIRLFTDSIIAQKILNGLFLLASSLLFFFFISRNKLPQTLAFTAAVVILLNYRVLEFATIMMSEMSYLFFSALILYLLNVFDRRESNTDKWWKNPILYVLILLAGYAFQIRTQGVAVVIGVIIWLLTVKKWRQAIIFLIGFVITTLPWTIRNYIVGLGSSRYIDQIIMVNIWRPEEGYISFGDLISRGFATLKMILTKAIPNTVLPYMKVDYNAPATLGEIIVAAILILLIIYGFRQYRRYFWFFMGYTAAIIGIICLWSAPSENRYLVTLVPMLEIGLITGVWRSIAFVCEKLKLKNTLSPLFLLIPALLLAMPQLKRVSEQSRQPFPPAYANFFKIAEEVRELLPSETVVCCRKPSLFYVYSHGYVRNYKYTLDDKELIVDLLENNVEYVVLEQLGYSSTYRYLYPAISNNPELFAPAIHLTNPDTYLLKFDRDAASRKFL